MLRMAAVSYVNQGTQGTVYLLSAWSAINHRKRNHWILVDERGYTGAKMSRSGSLS